MRQMRGVRRPGRRAAPSPTHPHGVPQLEAPEPPLACARYGRGPQVLQDMLWVYGDPSPAGWAAAAAAPVPPSAVPELLDGSYDIKSPWYSRE